MALDEAAIISKLEKSLSKKMEEIIADKQSQKEATPDQQTNGKKNITAEEVSVMIDKKMNKFGEEHDIIM